ncbi:MAG TPA: serine/threonine protein kinase, partial [Polyangiaceae bacterium]|nr:serine/threonine protein kinase [Polyangiaceae bacterium]
EPLAEGSMGAVYAATLIAADSLTEGQTEVAIKVLHPRHLREGQYLERFVREAKVAARLESPHAVRVLDVGMLDGGVPYFVMERLHGVDLQHHLEQVGTLSLTRARNYLLQACDALAEAHAMGVVHRDLKLANLFLAREEDGRDRIKVIDFGVSKLLRPIDEDGQATATTVVVGTPAFMAPEQMRSSKVDVRADVWALGVTLFWLVTGARPFEGDSIVKIYESILRGPSPMASLRPEVPPALEDLVRRCLQWNPDERLASVEDFAAELRAMDLSGASEEPALGTGEGVLATVAAAPLLDDVAVPPSVPPLSARSSSAGSRAVEQTALLDPRSLPPEAPSARKPPPWRGLAAGLLVAGLLTGAYVLGTMQSGASSTARLFAPTLLVALDNVDLPERAEPDRPAADDPAVDQDEPLADTGPTPRPVGRPLARPSKKPPLAPPKRPAKGDEVWGMP